MGTLGGDFGVFGVDFVAILGEIFGGNFGAILEGFLGDFGAILGIFGMDLGKF